MLPNRFDLVKQLYDAQAPERTIEGALGFLLRFCRAAGDDAGLLLKPGGENIVAYNGQMVSAGRICYPNGAIVKILSDVPTTNGPTWQDEGELVDVARYIAIPREVPVLPPAGPPPPPPPDVWALLHDHIAEVKAELIQQMNANTEAIQKQIDQVVKDTERTAGHYLPIFNRLFGGDK